MIAHAHAEFEPQRPFINPSCSPPIDLRNPVFRWGTLVGSWGVVFPEMSYAPGSSKCTHGQQTDAEIVALVIPQGTRSNSRIDTGTQYFAKIQTSNVEFEG